MPFELLPRNAQLASDATLRSEMPSYTYGLDLVNMRVQGKIDRQDAMRQAIMKQLQTWIRSCDIYDDNYGFEAHGLLGHDEAFIKSQLKRRIRDALRADKRIHDVRDFRFARGDAPDALAVQFRVLTRFGTLDWEGTISFA